MVIECSCVHDLLSAFLSHSSKDKEIAGDLKRRLREFRIEAFVAHDDIEGGEEWMDSLLEELKTCNAFLILLSVDYHKANYADHEFGIALGLGKPIIPIALDGTIPYGFMSKYQAMSGKKGITYDLCFDIADRIYKKVSKDESTMDILIDELYAAQSWDQANSMARLLFRHSEFSKPQLNRLAEAYLNNKEVSGGFTASKKIKELVARRMDELDPSIRHKFDKVLGS